MTEGRLAFVGGDRQVWLVQDDGQSHRQLTYGVELGVPSPWGGLQSSEQRSWPCWSPDGRWLSCFQCDDSSDGDGAAWLTAIEVDGVEEQRLVSLEEGYPIYSQWSPDSARIAVLMQQSDQLAVAVSAVGHIGTYRLIEEGVPVFFSWTADSRKMLIHSGSQGETRLVLRAVENDDPDEYFSIRPGNFCTPLVLGDRAVFVAQDGEKGTLCISDLQGEGVEQLSALSGMMANVASPNQRYLAFTSTPTGQRQPYDGLWIADLQSASVHQLMTDGVVAYFWQPDCEGLLVVTRGRGPSEYRWNRVSLDDGVLHPLTTFYPSQDQQFFLHFFEQFATSHSPISFDGRLLAYAGHPDPRTHNADSSSRIHVIGLHGEVSGPEIWAPGEFAVFAPRP